MPSYKHLPKNIQAVLKKHPTWGSLSAKFITYNANFMVSMHEISELESELDAFHTRHSLRPN